MNWQGHGNRHVEVGNAAKTGEIPPVEDDRRFQALKHFSSGAEAGT
jgi:hypothetical protein